MIFEGFGLVLIALLALLVLAEVRARRRRQRRAERMAGDPRYELEQRIEQQDALLEQLEGQRARQGVFAPPELEQAIREQRAELARLRHEYQALDGG
jgi:hypothetical protein